MMLSLPMKVMELTESQLHLLMEIIKGVIALTIAIIVLKKRKKRQKKIDQAIDKINKNMHL